MRADTAKAMNAKNSILIAATEESVKMLSLFSLILFVSGTADDAADNNMYATTCNSHQKVRIQSISCLTIDSQSRTSLQGFGSEVRAQSQKALFSLFIQFKLHVHL